MPPLADLLADPRYLLHRVDPAARRLLFVETRRDILSNASFLDGRTPLSDRAPLSVPIDAALAAAPPPGGRERYILHMSFCGSTLLARMCDVPGKAFAAKEPQALVDLADWAMAQRAAGVADSDFASVLALVRCQLAKRWSLGEPVVVKPSNWVNSLLRELFPNPRTERILLVEIGLPTFLTAVFRGGRERIVFTLRCLQALQTAFPDQAALVASAGRPGGGAFGPVARMIAVFHHLQRHAFANLGLDAGRRVLLREIAQTPAAALARAAEALDLPLDDADIAASAAAHIGFNAKAPGVAFDPAARRAEDRAVNLAHRDTIAATLDWAVAHLPRLPGDMAAPLARRA